MSPTMIRFDQSCVCQADTFREMIAGMVKETTDEYPTMAPEDCRSMVLQAMLLMMAPAGSC